MGYNTDISLGNTIIAINDQRQIGAAGGAAASGRTAVAAICQAVYGVVLSNQKLQQVPAHVVPSVLKAGLPESSIKSLLAALSVGTSAALAAVPGITPEIQAVAVRANLDALGQSYKVVWLVSLAFTGIGVILGVMSPNTERFLVKKVAITLTHGKQNQRNEPVPECV